VVQCFDLVAYFATGDVLPYRGVLSQTIEVSSHELSSPKSSNMTRFRVVVEKTYQLIAECFWHVYSRFESESS